MDIFIPIRTLNDELITLVPLFPSDFESLYLAASDPLIWEQHPNKDRYQRNVFKNYFDEAVNNKMAFKILDNNSGNIIGSSRFYEYNPELGSIAIGYTFLTRQYWGGKYNFALKNLMLQYAFNIVDRVIFHVGILNRRSQKAMEKIGAQLITEPQEYSRFDESKNVLFCITKTQWDDFLNRHNNRV
ncbi:MAG TPA: GNAT family N-acetyltransferase [Saprospiraceae bacterium]|nr:GNAT family N-acetyltransferase [Saprospiraceae bacterium]